MTRTSWFGVAGAAGALATDGLYLGVIASQGPPYEWGAVAVWASVIAAAALAILSGALLPPSQASQVLLLAGTAALVVLGVVALFSIGILLLVSALFAAVAAVRARRAA